MVIQRLACGTAPHEFAAGAGRAELLALKNRREAEAKAERDREESMRAGLEYQAKLDAEDAAAQEKKLAGEAPIEDF